MVRRRPLLPLGLALLGALALGACGGREIVLPSPVPSPIAPSPTPSARPTGPSAPTGAPTAPGSPTAAPELDLPRDAPTVLAERVDAADIARAGYAWLLPPNAAVLQARTTEGAVAQIALAWYRGEDPFARQSGLVLWQRFPDAPPWRAVLAFTNRPRAGVLGIALEQEDLTGDGIPDLLVREDTGGTGACARWRVIVPTEGAAHEAWRHEACDTTVHVADGTLAVREAVFAPDDPHCCPSRFRLRTLTWDGETFVQTRARTVPA